MWTDDQDNRCFGCWMTERFFFLWRGYGLLWKMYSCVFVLFCLYDAQIKCVALWRRLWSTGCVPSGCESETAQNSQRELKPKQFSSLCSDRERTKAKTVRSSDIEGTKAKTVLSLVFWLWRPSLFSFFFPFQRDTAHWLTFLYTDQVQTKPAIRLNGVSTL